MFAQVLASNAGASGETTTILGVALVFGLVLIGGLALTADNPERFGLHADSTTTDYADQRDENASFLPPRTPRSSARGGL
jgi:hypothetical protein